MNEKLSNATQIKIDEDVCFMDLRSDAHQERFDYPCRLEGSVLVFCIKGSVKLSVNLNEYEIKDGELIVCTDGDIIHVEKQAVLNTDDWHFVLLTMSREFASDLRLDFKRILNEGIIPFRTPVIKISETAQDILSDHLKLIAKVASEKGKMYKDSIRSLISSMVSVLVSQWFEEIDNLKPESAQETDTRSNHKRVVFEQFIKLVSENYSEHRMMAFYADKLCLSPKYLSKLVKSVSGKPAPEWIESYVMLEAKNLLRYSNMPIKEVVYRLNFPNQTSFYKYFKAHTGRTPTDYRNSI